MRLESPRAMDLQRVAVRLDDSASPGHESVLQRFAMTLDQGTLLL